MKEVEFVNVSSDLCGYGLGKGTKYRFNGVQAVSQKRIQDGWEYCGFVPYETRGTGDIETMKLIFQREKRYKLNL
jgi:hypothetical protein